MEKRHLDAAGEFIALIEKKRDDDAFGAGDGIIALGIALGFMIHYRDNDVTIDEVMEHVTALIRHNAERADETLAEKRKDKTH